MRKRLVELIGGRDDVVWASLRALADDAYTSAGLLERRLHDGGAYARELATAAQQADETLRRLNRHMHNSFAAPLKRDDALALGAAFERVAQTCADIGAALDARGEDRGRHDARRAASLLVAALQRIDRALADLAAARATGDATTDARGLLAEARGFIRQGLSEVLDAGLSTDRLLSCKDLYDRLDLVLGAARDAERLVDAIEPRGRAASGEAPARSDRRSA